MRYIYTAYIPYIYRGGLPSVAALSFKVVAPLERRRPSMHTDETSVLEQALALPAEQRLRLVDALLSSLNAPTSPEVERAWREEAERRVGEIETGRVRLIEGEEAFARLRAKYRQ
jgi:putative addiction module component (TIGR02574 family)